MRYIVYTKIHDFNKHTIENWYYGIYNTKDEANEVAYQLGHHDNIWHSICAENEAKDYNILNMPY